MSLDVQHTLEFFRFCFPMGPGSRVAITMDEGGSRSWLELIATAIAELGTESRELPCPTPAAPYESLPEVWRSEIGAFSHWIDLTRGGNQYGSAMKAFVRGGGKYLSAYGMSEATFRALVATDIAGIRRLEKVLKRQLRKKKLLRLTSELGTDLSVTFTPPSLAFDKISEEILENRTGEVCWVHGQLQLSLDFRSMNGQVVIEQFVWPPEECRALPSPLTIQLRQGELVDFRGAAAPALARHLERYRDDPRVRQIGHLVLGLIPDLQPGDCLVTNERRVGALTFGFGNMWSEEASTHTDMVTANCRIMADEWPLFEGGRLRLEDDR